MGSKKIGHQAAGSDQRGQTDQWQPMTGSCSDDRTGMRNAKAVRQTDQTAPRLARLSCDRFLADRVVVNSEKPHGCPKGTGCGLDLAGEQRRVRRGVRIEDYADPRYLWRHLLEELEPLSHDWRVDDPEPSDVAAGPCEAPN